MSEANRPVPWRYRLGVWLTVNGLPFGTKFMAWEIAHAMRHLSPSEQDAALAAAMLKVSAQVENCRKENKGF